MRIRCVASPSFAPSDAQLGLISDDAKQGIKQHIEHDLLNVHGRSGNLLEIIQLNILGMLMLYARA